MLTPSYNLSAPRSAFWLSIVCLLLTLPGLVGCRRAANEEREQNSDECPDDPEKTSPGECGCGISDVDTDGDLRPDCFDGCPENPNLKEPGPCGCQDFEGEVLDNGTLICVDECPEDPEKVLPGSCGCGVPDIDTDLDGYMDCIDQCPLDKQKHLPEECGCGVSENDADFDGVKDCKDVCPTDPGKQMDEGECGCGVSDVNTDDDAAPDCKDQCPLNWPKIEPGYCGCETADTDLDQDGAIDCIEECPDDPGKTDAGICGCGVSDTADEDLDGNPDCVDVCPGEDDFLNNDGDMEPDCLDDCPTNPDLTEFGPCHCDGDGTDDDDNDGVPWCIDQCDDDPTKLEPEICGCGTPDNHSDNDGVPDCEDRCPLDSQKTDPGICGCGTSDALDDDLDGIPNCKDNCPFKANNNQADRDGNGKGDACDRRTGGSTGDPHLLTFDGLRYDNQKLGAFILARAIGETNAFQVQTVQERLPSYSSRVTWNTRVAVQLGPDVVEYQLETHQTLLNTIPLELSDGQLVQLSDGVQLTEDSGIVLSRPDGLSVRIRDYGFYLGVDLEVPFDLSGQLSGLLGNFDLNHANEYLLRDGSSAPDPGSFLEDWRALEEEQLFAEPWIVVEQEDSEELAPTAEQLEDARILCEETLGAEACNDALVGAIAVDLAAGMSDLDAQAWVETTDTASPVVAYWYEDLDGDAYGNPAVTLSQADQPIGFVSRAHDCDDLNPDIRPGVEEIVGDSIDNNCNGLVDESSELRAFYAMETLSQLIDESGYEHHGTLYNVTLATAHSGWGYSFNGSNSRAIVPDSDSLDLDTAFTLAAWVSLQTGVNHDMAIISKIGGAQQEGYQMGFSASRELFCSFNSAGEPWPSVSVHAGLGWNPGIQFFHVACTYDGSTVRLYVNGALLTSREIGFKVVANTASNLRISSDDNGNAYFYGTLDEVAIFGRALSESELRGFAGL